MVDAFVPEKGLDEKAFFFGHLAANTHPDHALYTFRKRFPPEVERLFVEVLRIAQHMKLLTLGNGGLGWHDAARQRVTAQCAVLWTC